VAAVWQLRMRELIRILTSDEEQVLHFCPLAPGVYQKYSSVMHLGFAVVGFFILFCCFFWVVLGIEIKALWGALPLELCLQPLLFLFCF
jgi:hypothetical protein